MNFEDILIDEYGSVFVPGQMTIEGRGASHALGPPQHELLSLAFSKINLCCQPAPAVERLPNGFCTHSVAVPRLCFSPLGNILHTDNPPLVRFQEAAQCGAINLFGAAARQNKMSSLAQPIAEFECRSEFHTSGWRIVIRGSLGEVSAHSIGSYLGPLPPPGSFNVEALVPWEVLALKGMRNIGLRKWSLERETSGHKQNRDPEQAT